jgi:uncharacterized protein (DUF2236 family)
MSRIALPTRPPDHRESPPAGAGPIPYTAWLLHGERLAVLAWGRAILLQFAHPLVAAGVAEHSGFLRQTAGRRRRLEHTIGAMLALTFGTPDEAARAAAGINAIHDRVHGRLPAAAGRFPAGTPYSAHDPALLRWVHATLLDSTLLIYQRYVRPLTPAVRERYCAESTGIAPLLGIPDGYLPASTAALRAYMDEMYAGGAIAVSEIGRTLARAVVYPPSPPPARPFLALVRLPTVGLLPPHIRDAYGFPWDARRELALRRSAGLVRRLLPLLPPALRYWPAARAAWARNAKYERRSTNDE